MGTRTPRCSEDRRGHHQQAARRFAVDRPMGTKEDLVPEEWADPFADMRLDEDESSRAPFELRELQAIFTAAVFTKGERPKGGQGEAAFWLPLLALFGGERLSELTGLRVSDVAHNGLIGAVSIYINEDRKAGRRLKTKQSERYIPVHPKLIELGFLDFVAAQARTRGADAWFFLLWRREPTGPQRTPSGSGATSVRMESPTRPKYFIRSDIRSSTPSALRTLAMKSNTPYSDGAAAAFLRDTVRRTRPHVSDTGSLRRSPAWITRDWICRVLRTDAVKAGARSGAEGNPAGHRGNIMTEQLTKLRECHQREDPGNAMAEQARAKAKTLMPSWKRTVITWLR